jgi:hypothetical protein
MPPTLLLFTIPRFEKMLRNTNAMLEIMAPTNPATVDNAQFQIPSNAATGFTSEYARHKHIIVMENDNLSTDIESRGEQKQTSNIKVQLRSSSQGTTTNDG